MAVEDLDALGSSLGLPSEALGGFKTWPSFAASPLRRASFACDRERRMAERVGFEPTCPLRDKTLSRRPRYDHFGTSPLDDNAEVDPAL